MARILCRKKLLDGKDLHGKKLLPTSLAIQHLFSIQILAIQQLFPIHILSVRNKSTQEPGYEDTAQIGTNYKILKINHTRLYKSSVSCQVLENNTLRANLLTLSFSPRFLGGGGGGGSKEVLLAGYDNN